MGSGDVGMPVTVPPHEGETGTRTVFHPESSQLCPLCFGMSTTQTMKTENSNCSFDVQRFCDYLCSSEDLAAGFHQRSLDLDLQNGA